MGRVVAVASLFFTSVMGVSGCSLVAVTPPPDRINPPEPVRCTRSKAIPIMDAVFASFLIGRTLHFMISGGNDFRIEPLPRSADVVLGMAFGGLFGVSAGIGFDSVRRCNERPAHDPGAPDEEAEADVARAGAAAAEEARAAAAAAGASQKKQTRQPAPK